MSGLGEQGAKVASSVIEGLRGQPLSLALVVLNMVFIVFVAWLSYTVNARTEHQYQVKDELIIKLIEKCQKVTP
jgi:hypothetical protein